MKKKFKLGVIGAGFMATSIIKGAIKSKAVLSDEILVSDINDTSLMNIEKLNITTTKDNVYLANNSEFVLFAIKPQVLNTVLEEIKDCSCEKFVSIMAGVKKEKIKSIINNSQVVRCMPNTPCSIGKGVVGVDISDIINEQDKLFIMSLLNSFAKVVCLDEDKMHAVTGVSGSAPAYFYLFAKGLIQAGVKNGLTEEQAKIFVVNTMIGAGEMVNSNPDKTLDELINAVCSKGGTTIEAVKVYNENNLEDISLKAVNACVKRSKELENL